MNTNIITVYVFFLFRWQDNIAVLGVSGVILLTIFGLIMIEKLSFLPKSLTAISSFASNNKIMLQIMATTNVLALLACVIIPLVSFYRNSKIQLNLK